MRSIPLVNASVLEPLFRFVGEGRPERAAARLLPAGCLPGAGTLVPIAIAGELWEAAARETGLADLGLRVGSASRPEDVGSLGSVVRCAPDLGTAFGWAVRYGSRWSSGERYWLGVGGDEVVLNHTFSRAVRAGRGLGAEFVLALWIGLIRSAVGSDWRPTEIGLPGARPAHAAALETLAERVRFDQLHLSIQLPRALLGRRLPAPPAERLDPGPRAESDADTSLRLAVASLVELGSPDVTALARSAGLSVRSLQRRMKEDGVTFSTLLERCRVDAARRLLQDPRHKIVSIADTLGYTDPANFSRAFRRWTGVSPSEFRRTGTALQG